MIYGKKPNAEKHKPRYKLNNEDTSQIKKESKKNT
jgi:hypothetical protein